MGDWASTSPGKWRQMNQPGTTPGATAHTKGSYTTVTTLTRPSYGVLVRPDWMQSYGTARTVLMDLSTGGSGSETPLVNNFGLVPGGYSGASNSRDCQLAFFLPIIVPAGDVRFRSQSNYANHGACYVGFEFYDALTQPVFAVCDTYGENTASTRGTLVTASSSEGVNGAWVEMTPSCKQIKAFVISQLLPGNAWQTSQADQWHAIEVGVGPAGQEVIVWGGAHSGVNSSDGGVPQTSFGPVYVDIPAGQRVCIRMRRQWTTQRTLDFIMYGFR